jgi:hypothetical protein
MQKDNNFQNDSNYQAYSTWLVKDVPADNIKYLINLFLEKAALNMGCQVKENTNEGSVEIVKSYYSYIPVCYVASGMVKGSLGHYGAGLLAPKTVYHWLGEVTLEYNRDQAKTKLESSNNDIVMDLNRYPAGKAINQKIDWLKSGKITEHEWDKISLKQLTEDIANGITPDVLNYL